jgi:hypothetical protein
LVASGTTLASDRRRRVMIPLTATQAREEFRPRRSDVAQNVVVERL